MAASPSSWHKHTGVRRCLAMGGMEGLTTTTTTTITTFSCSVQCPVRPKGFNIRQHMAASPLTCAARRARLASAGAAPPPQRKRAQRRARVCATRKLGPQSGGIGWHIMPSTSCYGAAYRSRATLRQLGRTASALERPGCASVRAMVGARVWRAVAKGFRHASTHPFSKVQCH